MKKMTKFFALALLAGAMVSCSTEDTAPSTQNDKVAVQFTGGISVNTRAAGQAWADGDRIGIFMIEAGKTLSADVIKEGVDNVCYQSNGSIAFSPVSGGKTIFFPIDGNVDFYSYYPQTTVNDYKVALDVTDQTKQETIDFMYAKTEGCNKATPQVDLKFFHKLSNLILDVQPGNGLTQEDLKNMIVTVKGQNTKATFNLVDGIDRPRQMVNREQGKEAITEYEVLERIDDTHLRLALYPKTVKGIHLSNPVCPI